MSVCGLIPLGSRASARPALAGRDAAAGTPGTWPARYATLLVSTVACCGWVLSWT